MESPLCPPADRGFRLIETGLWTPEDGLRLVDLHLERLRTSAARLGIGIDGLDAALEGIEASAPRRLRLTVDAGGQVEVALHEFTPEPEGRAWRLAVSEARLIATDPWLTVKSTERDLYDRTRAELPEGVEEVIFLNSDGAVCEGTITNIFVDRGDGLETPSLSCGVLPGVLRASLIAEGRAREAVLTPADLAGARALYVGNALRGLIPARLV
ncbi:putative branched-chain-amino-acid aminotransferase [Roseovarius sp. THAF8]|uniref:aminotransferase class IV family protein n=1 Tax=Roseovarius sp. THAF8 TaxID=2587846 RepID=UPI0012684E62|nr:aminotransferase class IV family protein [Roseovarius sp. THAF8]QFT98824.1 putative branched-chain-amino-acid aminotransferase [Roseovarius sp. THAF8]